MMECKGVMIRGGDGVCVCVSQLLSSLPVVYFWEQLACCEVTKRQPGGKIKCTPPSLYLYLQFVPKRNAYVSKTFEYHAALLCCSKTVSAGEAQPDETGLFCVDMTRNTLQTRV